MNQPTNQGNEPAVNNDMSSVNNDSPKETPADPQADQINNLNAALRAERAELKKLKGELDSVRNSHLEEQGKYKELYEAQKSDYDSLKTKVDSYESFMSQTVEDAKAKLPENVLKLFPGSASPQEQLAWINEASEVFSSQQPSTPTPRPNLTRGRVNVPDSDTRVRVSEEEFARMSLADRAKVVDQFVERDPFTGKPLLQKR